MQVAIACATAAGSDVAYGPLAAEFITNPHRHRNHNQKPTAQPARACQSPVPHPFCSRTQYTCPSWFSRLRPPPQPTHARCPPAPAGASALSSRSFPQGPSSLPLRSHVCSMAQRLSLARLLARSLESSLARLPPFIRPGLSVSSFMYVESNVAAERIHISFNPHFLQPSHLHTFTFFYILSWRERRGSFQASSSSWGTSLRCTSTLKSLSYLEGRG